MSQAGRYIPLSGPGSGTVTSISAGTGITLTPNPIVATGTVALTVPVAIANGGTNATSMVTTNGIVKYDGTRLVTSSTAQIDASNRMTNTSQPAFQYYLGTNDTNATGNGALYQLGSGNALTQVFDQGNNMTVGGVFTAPVDGIYCFQMGILLLNNTSTSELILQFNASTGTFYDVRNNRNASANSFGMGGCVLLKLPALATVVFQVVASGNPGDTCTVQGAQNNTFVSGYLVC